MPVRKRFFLARPKASPSAAAPEPELSTPLPQAPEPVRAPRPRREVIDDPPLPPPTAIRGLYRRIGTTLALIGATLIGSLMWYYGGVFSLDYIGDTFAPVGAFIQRSPWWQHWWLPVLISAIEIFLWPRRERRLPIFLLRLGLWLAVLAFDVLTTVRGLLPVLAGVGLTNLEPVADRLWVTYSISGLFGLAFAYLPEKIARWVISDLWNLWVVPTWRRIRRRRPVEAAA
ncbi:hypothetical protein HC891_16130 [Candidatus Gracilibacteria bacterium]|nr:hypothetical protein [Candidatus Gracilibacteria bacterium]